MAVSLFFVFSSNCKRFFVLTPPHPPFLPSVTPFLLPAMIIHHWAGPTFSFPQNQLPIMLIKVGGVGWRGGDWFWFEFQMPPDFLLLGKRALKELLKRCVFFCFSFPQMIKASVSQTWRASPKWLFKWHRKSLAVWRTLACLHRDTC